MIQRIAKCIQAQLKCTVLTTLLNKSNINISWTMVKDDKNSKKKR